MTQPWPYHVQLPPPRRRFPVWAIVIVVGGAVAVLSAIVIAIVVAVNYSYETDRTNAIRFCQALAERSYNVFQFSETNARQTAMGTWEVTGTVVGLNPYGYQKRGDYSCTGIRPDPSDSTYLISDGVVVTTR